MRKQTRKTRAGGWAAGAMMGLVALLLLLGLGEWAPAAGRLDRYVVNMTAASLTNAATGSFRQTGGGTAEVVEILSAVTNASSTLAVRLEVAPDIYRTVALSWGSETNELGVLTNRLDYVTLKPPRERTVDLPDNLYLWSGQQLEFETSTNLVDHVIFLTLKRLQ